MTITIHWKNSITWAPRRPKGCKHGFRILSGIQSYAQLDQTYGKNNATTLKNSFRNTLSLGISEVDTNTAEEISKGLGEHEVVCMKKCANVAHSARRAAAARRLNRFLDGWFIRPKYTRCLTSPAI